MKHLSGLQLRVPDPAKLAAFYTDVMGMQVFQQGDVWRLGYPGQDADLIFVSVPASEGWCYEAAPTDRYWKIGICLPDLDTACAQLRAAGVEVSAPRQFLDIGYMAHMHDPAGFVIELLQHDFAGQWKAGQGNAGDSNLPLGGGAHIGQITLRTGDIAAELQRFDDMALLSVQEVKEYGFDLYFLAYTDEVPPNADLRAIENRPWLWRRPYTTLEFQHVAGAVFEPTRAFEGLEITSS